MSDEFKSRPLTPEELELIKAVLGEDTYERIEKSPLLTNFDLKQAPIYEAALKHDNWSELVMIGPAHGGWSNMLGLYFRPEVMVNGRRPADADLGPFWALIRAIEAIEKARAPGHWMTPK